MGSKVLPFLGPFLCQLQAVGALRGTAALVNSAGASAARHGTAQYGTARLGSHPAGWLHCASQVQSCQGQRSLSHQQGPCQLSTKGHGAGAELRAAHGHPWGWWADRGMVQGTGERLDVSALGQQHLMVYIQSPLLTS